MTKTVEEVLATFEKKYSLKVGRPDQVIGLPTGNIAIDWQTGIGGIPVGRITELYGYEASGKTTTALQTAAVLQADIKARGSDERILYFDFEHALDSEYAEGLGIDFEHPSFLPLQPSFLEQGAKAALDLIDTGKIRLAVFDSVAAMSPRRQTEGEFDQATVQMHRAKLISAFCQALIGIIHDRDCAAVFINHKMESIAIGGVKPGLPPKITTPGGRGLKFYASMRLEFDVFTALKGSEEEMTGLETRLETGNRVFVKCVKNKVGSPGRTVELRSRYGHGFDNHWSALQVLVNAKKITKAGAWMTFKAEELRHPEMEPAGKLHGEGRALEFARTHPEWGTTLVKLAEQAAREQVEDQ